MTCCGGRSKSETSTAGYGYTHVRWQGQGSIKVHGGTTGRTYRFDGYGSVVAIDTRDMGNVRSIPNMIEVG